MKIKAISYRVPSKLISNDDVLDFIDSKNPNIVRSNKAVYLKFVNRLLRQTGAKTRYWLDLAAGERAIDSILPVMDEALNQAGLKPKNIDLLIYCGVGRGFLEPANAYFYARLKGMTSAQCFDITDACMSWVRALQIAQQMLETGAYRTIMVLNAEFNFASHGNWEIRGLQSLNYTFPMYTIGEATTATIVTGEGEPWRFDYLSRPGSASLCTIPLEDYASYIGFDETVNLNGINRFVSFGKELFEESRRALVTLFTQTITDVHSHTLYFPHAPSKTIYEDVWAALGHPAEKLFLSVYPRFGNLVSASIPVGLCLAQAEGRLCEGNSIAFIPASAGIVAAVAQLKF